MSCEVNSKQMTFEQAYETIPQGWLSKPEAELLWRIAQEAEGPILEVGSYRGRSTCLLAQLGRPVYAVDPFDGFDSDMPGDAICAALMGNLKDRGLDNVQVFRQRVEDWTARDVGFAYLDGDHSYSGTRSQILKAWECGATFLAVHDCNDEGGGLEVKRAALEMLGPWSERIERLAVWRPACGQPSD